MKRSNLVFLGVAGFVAAVLAPIACSPVAQRLPDPCADDPNACGTSGGGGGFGPASSSSGDGGTNFVTSSSSASGAGGGIIMCDNDPNIDNDGDGTTENQGDCNDCDPNVGPGAVEVLTDPNDPQAPIADEDCDGTADNVAPFCDDNLMLDDITAESGVRAVDICQFVNPGEAKWGVREALYVRANGAPAPPNLQAGLLANFGPNVAPQGGSHLLVLSTGRARLPGQPDACNMVTCSGSGMGVPPMGFPQDPINCPVSMTISDDVGLQVRLRAPTNATGYKFSFKFYTFEYPENICGMYNDQFITLVNPAPLGAINGNISFDSQKHPVSVNIAFFDVCDYNAAFPQYLCANGPSEMNGTGFNTWNSAGGTAWLESQAPVQGGQDVTIRWTIWDTGDSGVDSTVIVDNFQWIAKGGTVVVGTNPIPDPH
ncbi:MAG TPA: choice-of-anchor L domain-containing protein [Polyangium sp.]|nr:choice-of-anchor L domain-containing protein [Polyangium sp.]